MILESRFLLANRGKRNAHVLFASGKLRRGARKFHRSQSAKVDLAFRILVELLCDLKRLLPRFQRISSAHQIPILRYHARHQGFQLRPESIASRDLVVERHLNLARIHCESASLQQVDIRENLQVWRDGGIVFIEGRVFAQVLFVTLHLHEAARRQALLDVITVNALPVHQRRDSAQHLDRLRKRDVRKARLAYHDRIHNLRRSSDLRRRHAAVSTISACTRAARADAGAPRCAKNAQPRVRSADLRVRPRYAAWRAARLRSLHRPFRVARSIARHF